MNIASLDRQEEGILGLPRLIANSLNRDLDQIFQNSDRGVLADVELLQSINQATRAAVSALVRTQADADGRVSRVSRLNFFNMGRKEPWIEALQDAGYSQVDPEA